MRTGKSTNSLKVLQVPHKDCFSEPLLMRVEGRMDLRALARDQGPFAKGVSRLALKG
jgi:hypothetical protein